MTGLIGRGPFAIVALLALLGAGGAGCTTFPPALDVRADNTTRDAQNIEVHLLAVNHADYERYLRMPMTQYWQPGGPGRQQTGNPNCRIIYLSPGTRAVLIPKDDPIWQRWRNASLTHLLVMADLSNVPNRDTSQDPRRAALPLDRNKVKYPKTVMINVGRSGIRFEPPWDGNRFRGVG